MQIETNTNIKEAEKILSQGLYNALFQGLIRGKKLYMFKIQMYQDQYLLAFPKFGKLAIGFSQEKVFNLNLPYDCDAEQIFERISPNKRYKNITNEQCLKAIKLLQRHCAEYFIGNGLAKVS